MKIIIEDFYYKGNHYDYFEFEMEDTGDDISDYDITRALILKLDGEE